MHYTIERINVRVATLDDKPGALGAALAPLAEAGANLEFVLARRAERGKALVFVAPIKGAPQGRAARGAGFETTDELEALRIEGPDKKGLGAMIAQALGDAGVNLRGFSAMALGKRVTAYVAVDSKQDAAKGRRVLTKVLR
jgi:hypothetical protein